MPDRDGERDPREGHEHQDETTNEADHQTIIVLRITGTKRRAEEGVISRSHLCTKVRKERFLQCDLTFARLRSSCSETV